MRTLSSSSTYPLHLHRSVYPVSESEETLLLSSRLPLGLEEENPKRSSSRLPAAPASAARISKSRFKWTFCVLLWEKRSSASHRRGGGWRTLTCEGRLSADRIKSKKKRGRRKEAETEERWRTRVVSHFPKRLFGWIRTKKSRKEDLNPCILHY